MVHNTKVPSSQWKLEELLTCPVCLERLSDPKMLPCQHTFCRDCVRRQGSLKEGQCLSKVRCAQCRAETTLPRGGVAGLPSNLYAQSLIDIIQAGELRCHACATACEVRMCDHCNHAFCAICEQRHLVELRERLRIVAEQLDIAKVAVLRKTQAYLMSCERLRENLHLEVQRRVLEVLAEEGRQASRIDTACGQAKVTASEVARRLEVVAAEVVALLDVEVEGTAREKVRKFLLVHKQSADTISTAESTTFDNLSFLPETLTVTLGSDVAPASPPTLPGGKEEGSSSAPASLQTDLDPGRRKKTKQPDGENAKSLLYRCKSFVSRACVGASLLQRPSGIAFSPWSAEVFVVSMDTHKVHVFEAGRGKFVRSFGSRGHKQGEFLCPSGVTASAVTQEVLVSDKWKHCVMAFGRDGRFLRQFGSKGRSAGQFRSPEAICADSAGQLYVCDTINCRIQILDKEGAFLRQIDGQVAPSGGPSTPRSLLFQEPAGVAVGPDGRIAVCDPPNHRVHVFDQQGAPMFTCGQKGSLRGQFQSPECVAIDDQCFLLVGDSGNCRIQIFRPDGRFVRAFGSKGSTSGHFSWISGLAVAPSNAIAVCDFKNHSLQIF